MDITQLLKLAIEQRATDLHLVVGSPPMLRINGQLTPVDHPSLTQEATQSLIYSILNDEQIKKFQKEKELDLSISLQDIGRFRVNVHYQQSTIAAAYRAIPMKVPTMEELKLPETLATLANKTSGLILVTGPTGSGKSTTLAAVIDLINSNRLCHIITIEDPIEYLHKHKKSLIEQREIGSDSYSFANALKYALRQDPDVILIGEMRDLETISAALTAAETGHLVLATLHTVDAAQTIDRIVDVFPPHQQTQIRMQLAQVLLGVFCQRLLPKADGKGLIAAIEVMIGTPAIATLIREGKTHQVHSSIETGGATGMRTMDKALGQLIKRKLISRQEAEKYAKKIDDLDRYASQPG